MAPSTMYQHFVPQFLLRNFAHPYDNVESDGSRAAKRPKKTKRQNGKLFPGDPVVHSAALSEDPIKLTETPVKRILGQMDMYRDTSQPHLTLRQQNHIEDMFGKIESRVSTIFRKITKLFDAGDSGLWLTRKERNDVRKFLFLLKYRGSGFHLRFNHSTLDDYDEDDKELFQEYMSERGFTRPIDVWLDNLKAIMELDMDAAGEWMEKIRKRIYRTDAEWFIMHTQFFYMAICTPENPTDEFIVTDSCYNVFEGRTGYANNAVTGEVDAVTWINLHEFTPISPKLMLILRSFLFPLPEEDINPKIKKFREELCRVAVNNVFGTETLQNSPLFDLPISKARNSYTTSVGGTLRLLGGEDGTHKHSHKFCFTFFPIKQIHVHIINGIFFDNAITCTHAVFASKDSFLKSLEWYMTTAPEVVGGKIVHLADGDKRLQLLEKLDALMKALGSNKKSVWDDAPMPGSEGHYHREFYRYWITHLWRETRKMKDDPSMPRNRILVTHAILGGSSNLFWNDLDQGRRMWTLRVKIDSWSQGVDEGIRQRNRILLLEAYHRMPPEQFWFYMKFVKFNHLFMGDVSSGGRKPHMSADGGEEESIEGMEDTIATARLLVQHDNDINHIIYTAVMNEIQLKKHPGFNIWQNIAFTRADWPRMFLMMEFVFDLPGRICFCGIPEIALLALATEYQLRQTGAIEVQGFDTRLFTEDQVIEIVTRIKVRGRFTEVLEGKMKLAALAELKKAFFEFAYPTPPTRDL